MSVYRIVAAVAAALIGCSDAPDRDSAPPDAAAPGVDLAHSSFVIDRTTAVVGVDVVHIAISLADPDGLPVENAVVVLTATGSDNDVGTVPPSDASGQTSATWSSTKAEAKTLTATLEDGSVLGTHTVTFVPGPAARPRFIEQPLGNEAGGPFSTAVALDDEFGNFAANSNTVVTLQLGNNPGAATLGGTLARAANAGIVTFDALTLDVAAAGYTLRAGGFGLSSAESDSFDITPGTPTMATSTFSVAPHSVDADGVSVAEIAMTIKNQYGIPIDAAPVMLAVSGTGNLLSATSGATAADGRFAATLASTVAEPKTITATVAPLTVTGMTYFYAPACTLQLPWRPEVPLFTTPTAFLVADLDQDGHPDTVEAQSAASKLVVRLGHGDGQFGAPIETSLTGEIMGLYSADLDSDGNPDLVALRSDAAEVAILLGAGDGSFAPAVTQTLPALGGGVAIADLDGDDVPDLVATITSTSEIRIYPGQGNGTFGSPTALAGGYRMGDVAAVDLDGNGTRDLVVANDSTLWTFLGNGDGTFGAHQTATTFVVYSRMQTGDFNGDGKADVFVADRQHDQVLAFVSNGDGTLANTWEISTTLYSPSIALGDFDGDGALDLVLGTTPRHRQYHGNGDGTFTPAHDYAFDSQSQLGASGGLYAADVDGDQLLDLIGGGGGIAVARGLAGGTFNAPVLYGSQGFLYDTAADFDGNGVADLVAFDTTYRNRAWLTQPDGAPVLAGQFYDSTQPSCGAAGDLDHDGTQDVVAVNAGAFVLAVAFGQGDGTFTNGASVSLSGAYTDGVLLANLDGDSNPDLVLRASSGRAMYVAPGNGDGTFGTRVKYTTTSDPVDVVAVDTDNDGDLDLVLGERKPGLLGNGKLNIYVNSGLGTFGPPTTKAFAEPVDAFAIADFDGDSIVDYAVLHGDLEIIKGGSTLTAIGPPYVIGDFEYESKTRIEAADLDADGTVDLIVQASHGYWILQGFGDGYFRPARFYGIRGGGGLMIAPPFVVGDRNGDGAPDLAISAGDGIAVALQGECIPFAP